MINKIKKRISRVDVRIKSSFVYILASVITKGLNLITLPIFTRLMQTDQIGVVNVYTSWFAIINTITSLALNSGGLNLGFKTFSDHKKEYCSSMTFLTTISAGAFVLLWIVFSDEWYSITGISKALMPLFFLGIIVTPSFDFWLALNKYENKYKVVGIVSFISSTLSTLLSVIAVYWANSNNYIDTAFFRLYFGVGVSYIISFIIYIYSYCKGKTYVNIEYWKFSLSLSGPLIFYTFASEVLNVSDRTMISYYIGNSEVGIYSTMYALASITLIVWNGLTAVFVPYLYEGLDDKKQYDQIRKTTYGIIGFFGIILIIVTAFAPDIVNIFTTSEYKDGISLIPPIAAGIFMISITGIYSCLLIYLRKSKYMLIGVSVAAVVNVILNYFGIAHYGYKVAAYTTFFSYIIMTLIQQYIVKKEYIKSTGNAFIFNIRVFSVIAVTVFIGCFINLIFYELGYLRYAYILIICIVIFTNKKNLKELLRYIR